MLAKEIETRIGEYIDPYLRCSLSAAKAIKSVQISPEKVSIEISLGYPHDGMKAAYAAALENTISDMMGGRRADIVFTQHIEAHRIKAGTIKLPEIKNIIAVASGKGGVGKSTIAIHLAIALAKEGAKVGLLDADIYGPSQPTMLGTQKDKPILKDGQFQPILRYGIATMSMGYLIAQDAAMVWRGPMIGKAMQQLLQDTTWKGLDYLIVDLPPGTGDVQLTLCQKMPVSGVVMVTTPQEMALIDVRRACTMFRQLDVPILGIIENMHLYRCTQCGHEEAIFGTEGATSLAEEYGTTVLQEIPLHKRIREMSDAGLSPVLEEADSAYADAFLQMARKVGASLARQPKDYASKFPPIVVESK